MNDVLTRVLIPSFLDFDGLRKAARVCRVWRTAVWENPRFVTRWKLFQKYYATGRPDWDKLLTIVVQYGFEDVLALASKLHGRFQGHDHIAAEKYRCVYDIKEMWNWNETGSAVFMRLDDEHVLLALVERYEPSMGLEGHRGRRFHVCLCKRRGGGR